MNTKISVTPSLAIEYMYCPRFIYYMEVLGIPQNEDNRYKVMAGREVHKIKELSNKDYLRSKIGVIKKISEEELYSDKFQIHGKIDEILFLDDNTMAPLDYKFAEYKEKIYKTYKIQAVMYAMLIKDNYNVEVNRAYIVYSRSKNRVVSIEITKADEELVKKIVDEILNIIQKNYYPKMTSVKSRCIDCCYRNICIN